MDEVRTKPGLWNDACFFILVHVIFFGSAFGTTGFVHDLFVQQDHKLVIQAKARQILIHLHYPQRIFSFMTLFQYKAVRCEVCRHLSLQAMAIWASMARTAA